MNIQQSIVFVSAFASCVALADGQKINLIDCPKCDKRMRICADGQSATINLARLQDDAPDAATLKAGTGYYKEVAGASGGMVAANCRQLVWREVWSAQGGDYQVEVRTPDGVYTSYATTLQPGLNAIGLAMPDGAPLPDIDCLTIARTAR